MASQAGSWKTPLFQSILEDIQKCIKRLQEKSQSLNNQVETTSKLLKSLKEQKEKHDELKKKIEELEKKSSSSLDAHKMYGDIRPGDTTHQDVMMAYTNFYKTAVRKLPQELTEADMLEVLEVMSDIVQESFKRNKDDIIQKIKEKLEKVLLADKPVSKPLDEDTTDLIRAFSMFIERDQLQKVKQNLLKASPSCDHPDVERAAEILEKNLNPKHYFSFFQHDSTTKSELPADRMVKAAELHCNESRGKNEKHSKKPSGSATDPRSKKKPEPVLDTEALQKLKEKMKDAIEIIESLEKKESLQRELSTLAEEIETMKKRAEEPTESMPVHTLKISKDDVVQKHLRDMISKLINNFVYDLESILECTSDEYNDEGSDTREKYKIYGLMLSACGLRKSKPPEHMVQDLATIERKYQIDKKYVQEAVTITRDMLTLLPPLIMTVHPKVYDERLHDIKRPAWDESGENDETRKLTYYRPILVYGNELHVAVKGTVGNKKNYT